LISEKLKKIRLVLLDVDGVLTDGSVIYSDNGAETKVFHVKDGLGIKLLMKAGIEVGIVTGRASEALLHRCRNLGIRHVYDDVRDKASALEQILEKNRISAQEIAFVGDDLPDIPIMKRVGLPIAVADAHEAVIESADIVTIANGGKGAVREICEKILQSRGLWGDILKQYLG
jgi:3-deoxy-D-manno-octulosonate 8-phosphate phosphatase (KDO 8-P phosphatase)